MPECECGAHVTADYVRVFGSADGTVTGCPHCMGGRNISSGCPHPEVNVERPSDQGPRREASQRQMEARK